MKWDDVPVCDPYHGAYILLVE